ncbi:ABC-three component system protein [Anaerotignum sp.]|uniref:ABC-three component system protein n=1 Tax=Anaerotignum sp. TaxID=2039241 RepID=UPI002714729A|nr:ABC-three component system protein [Anaerotignum sp.]
MERDFRYLREKYGDHGARDIFEKICIQLFQKKFENAYAVQASPGDDGIDVLVGDLDKHMIVYQCKYFIDGIGATQKSQIKESYKTVTEKYKVAEWYLCVPILFTVENHKWWSNWKTEKQQDDNLKVELMDGSRLLMILQECDMYDRVFDEDLRLALKEIKNYLKEENARIYNEIIYDINDFSDISYKDCIFVKMLESANIFDIDDYKNDFFNAEIAKQKILSKGQTKEEIAYNQLQKKLRSVWKTQYNMYKHPTDGNELANNTYLRIEDLDTTTLKSSNDISLLAKKGMRHQLAEDKKLGWVDGYIQKLELYMEAEKDDGNG